MERFISYIPLKPLYGGSMRSSLSFVVLWALAGSSVALADADTHGIGSKNLAARDITDTVGGADIDLDLDLGPGTGAVEIGDEGEWDENLSIRSLAPEIFEGQEAHAQVNKLSRRAPTRGGTIPMISFNVNPGVVNDDPIIQRKNPAREHWEFLCNWRSPREDFNIRYIYDLLTGHLDDYTNQADWCSGPNNFCTKVWCHSGYFVEVCNYGETPWQVLCGNIIQVARDIVIAKANIAFEVWEKGLVPEEQRSKQQETNDRKKICINHSSVYQPEAIGIAFWNTMPRWFVRLSYGYSDKRVKCSPVGIQPPVQRQAASQEQYMKGWYDKIQLTELEGDDDDDKDKPTNPKPALKVTMDRNKQATEGRVFPPKGSPNDTDPYGLPLYRDPHGTYPIVPNITATTDGYIGPPIENYDPQDFVIPGLSIPEEDEDEDEDDTPTVSKNATGKAANAKPAGPNEVSLDDGKKNDKPNNNSKKSGSKAKHTPFSAASMWFPPGYTRPALFPTIRHKKTSEFHWPSYSKTWTITHHRSAAAQPAKPEKAAPTAGADKSGKTDDSVAAAAATATPASDSARVTSAPAATVPPAAEPTGDVAKSDVKGDVPANTPTAKPSPSGEATSEKPQKPEPTSAKEEPTAVKTEPTGAKEEPAPSKSEAAPPKAEPTPEKNEPKSAPAKDEAQPTSAKDEVKPTAAPTAGAK
ncbi:hypothetical protein TWF718_002898 [Orbilia javanica]|uniref:Uncharacterized protein n=1 Tax=Orbilia javanica TaxID=47235 RepID=A0AAN8MEZ0_9PEZI